MRYTICVYGPGTETGESGDLTDAETGRRVLKAFASGNIASVDATYGIATVELTDDQLAKVG